MRGWLLLACVAALAGCYDQPKPSCSFTCDPALPVADQCPADYQCVAADRLCHLSLAGGGVAECPGLLPDASGDAADAPVDAGFDAPVDGAFDAAVDAAFDAPPIDAAPIDAMVDAAPVDAAPIDAMVDAAPIDAAPIDAAVDAAPPAVQVISCVGQTPDAEITTTSSAYVPVTTTIAAGDVIRFTPVGPHDMVSGTGGVGDGEFATTTSQVACLRFNVAGTYPFFCSVHEFTGTIVVN